MGSETSISKLAGSIQALSGKANRIESFDMEGFNASVEFDTNIAEDCKRNMGKILQSINKLEEDVLEMQHAIMDMEDRIDQNQEMLAKQERDLIFEWVPEITITEHTGDLIHHVITKIIHDFPRQLIDKLMWTRGISPMITSMKCTDEIVLFKHSTILYG